MEKAARILRAFTVDGVETTIEDKDAKGVKKQRKVIRKVPHSVIASAKGLAIFTSMRTGLAPFGGAGGMVQCRTLFWDLCSQNQGAGVVVAKLPDGSELHRHLRPQQALD